MASSKQEAAKSGPSSELGLEEGGADTAEGALRPSDILGQKLHRMHLRLVTALKRRQVVGSYDVACQTIQYLRQVIGQTRWRDVATLIQYIRCLGRELVRAQPVELTCGNIVRRVLHTIREEYKQQIAELQSKQRSDVAGGSPASPALDSRPSDALSRIEDSVDYQQQVTKDMRALLMDAIREIVHELENRIGPIASQAHNHIHSNELILTCGYSSTLLNFFKKPVEDTRKTNPLSFEVFVAESAPSFAGHKMGRELAAAGIQTTVIIDSAVFALLARINKVIIPCHAVMANGGIVARAGTHAICVAAKHHRCPVICVTGLYKLSPLYPHDQDSLNVLMSPNAVLPFKDCSTSVADKTEVVNPQFDYIPPDLVDLFITNVSVVPQLQSGGHQPSYVYRLLSEYYSPEDYDLSDSPAAPRQRSL